MLNTSFSRALQSNIKAPYVASPEIADSILTGNQAFDTGGLEYRLQDVYGKEIWDRLKRAGFGSDSFQESDVLEVCVGTGFLTYHLLRHCRPRLITLNDISSTELDRAQGLVNNSYPDINVAYVPGNIYDLNYREAFDKIIGNSFLHHFHDVPKALTHFATMLRPNGVFISLHEPTPMSTVVESAKIAAYPLAVLAPRFTNDIARSRYKGKSSCTDLWMFNAGEIKQVALESGFRTVKIFPWGLLRPLITQRYGLHLSYRKPQLSVKEERLFYQAIFVDGVLNRMLPSRFFGSICVVCYR